MNFFESLSKEEIEKGQLPHKNILWNSLFYPSSGFDGGVIKDCNTLARQREIFSFIYCDYTAGKIALHEAQSTFRGYHVFASRQVKKDELIPRGWKPKLPPDFDLERYESYKDLWQPFCTWIVYERDLNESEDHGPKRFSLLYIGGEGVATYQALYWSNKFVPTALAIIQPGDGFGFNWTSFGDEKGPLAWVVNQNPAGTPDIIYFGGIGKGYSMTWKKYKQERIISNYYGIGGEVKVYTKK